MDETTEKYLSQLLEGCEKNIGPLKAAINQMEGQLADMLSQEEAMQEAVTELKELLGLEEEEDSSEDDTDDEEG
jgi:regulator of replication initiation timing